MVPSDVTYLKYIYIQDKHEECHQPKMHKGLVIKQNANQRYATNAITSFKFREIAKMRGLPTQVLVSITFPKSFNYSKQVDAVMIP